MLDAVGVPLFILDVQKKKDDVSKELSLGYDIDHQFGGLLLSGERKASMN